MKSHLSAALPYFRAVAEAGSLTRAAEACSVTQPALSRKIRQLEEGLKVQLFRRHARGMSLTAAGEILLRRSRLADVETRRAFDEIELLRGTGYGRLAISAGPVWCLSIMPGAIAAVLEAFPGTVVDLRMSSGAPDIQTVADGHVDLYAGSLDTTLCRELGLAFVQSLVLDYRIYASPDHPLQAVASLTLEDLADQMWVGYAQNGAWPFIEDMIGRSTGAKPRAPVQSASMLAALEIARQTGRLIGLAHPLARFAEASGLRPLSSQPLNFSFPTGYCYRPSSSGLAPFALLVSTLQQSGSLLDGARQDGRDRSLHDQRDTVI